MKAVGGAGSDRLRLAAVYRPDRTREQTQLPAQNDELAANRSDRSAVCRRKVAIVLKSGADRPVRELLPRGTDGILTRSAK